MSLGQFELSDAFVDNDLRAVRVLKIKLDLEELMDAKALGTLDSLIDNLTNQFREQLIQLY